MPTPITMPQLGESVTEGVVARWLKAEGDHVERDEPLLEIITDKVTAEMPSPLSGTLVKIVAPEGATIPVGGEIAQIEVAGAVPAGVGARPDAPQPSRAEEPAPSAGLRASPAGANGAHKEAEAGDRKRYSPVVKRLAQEHDVDLSHINGTGLSGRVTKDDVLSYVAERRQGATTTPPTPVFTPVVPSAPPAAPAAPPVASPAVEPTLPPLVASSVPITPPPASTAGPVLPPLDATVAPPALAHVAPPPASAAVVDAAPGSTGTRVDDDDLPLTPMRKAIAEHMVRSKHSAPHAMTMIEVDMTRLARWREANKETVRARHGVDITFVPLIMQAVAGALKTFPIMNSSWGEDRIILKRRINIGVAVGLDDGLVVPVVHDADEKSLVGLARAVNAVVERARANRLSLQDMQGGTFTVNNVGVFGAVVTTPVINQPQAAILAMNAIVKRPVVLDDDAIAVRSMMNLTLSFDHRIVDGLYAGRFMQQIVKNIVGLDVSNLS